MEALGEEHAEGRRRRQRADQKAGGVVQEAAEATHKVPLQEGRVLRRKLFRVVGEQRRAAVWFHLWTDRETKKELMYDVMQTTLVFFR